ncbi:TRAP transporter large permease [Aquibacillus sediminis]|uniref:TRAP transporter large permease n=1 Tax=Aquibacillus sediminis TaxID=2574734 RepID=UPI001109EEA7|nr:TRAP transporter large permease [Aquibacillus sediminis]
MLALLFISMFLGILLGMDMAFVLLMSPILIVLLSHMPGGLSIPIEVIPQYIFGGMDSFSFTAIPLFILAGELMNRGGITDKLVEFAQKLIGHIRGGVGQVGVVINVIMAGMSGSAVADCASTGSVLIPAMKKDGYSSERSAAIIASASTIGPVFPPSIPLIIIGSISGISVGKLFLAGIIPGIIMGIALMVYIYIYAKKNKLAVKKKATHKERFQSTKSAFFALLLPVFIVGSIVTGIASPTESAAIGVLYALIVTVFYYKEMNAKLLYKVLLNSTIATGAIGLVTVGGVLFGWVATYYDIGIVIKDILFSISTNPIVILLIVNLMLIILGMVIEAIPIILLSVPIMFPILTSLGIDPIHFSIIMTVNLMIGLVTPPVGLHLFITSSIAKVPIMSVIRESFPFVIVLLVALLIVTFVPQTSLFIPSLFN